MINSGIVSKYGSETNLSPHPPSEPHHNRREIVVKTRERQYRHQSLEPKLGRQTDELREIRSAGCSNENSFHNTCRSNSKVKISSAPSPRSLTNEYRLNTVRKKLSTGLYTFDSIPSLIPEKCIVTHLPRTKRKEFVSKSLLSIEPDLPPINTSRSIKPCKSQASPVTPDTAQGLRRLKRQSLQQMSRDKLKQLTRKSFQSSMCQSKQFECSESCANFHSQDLFGQSNEPINLTHYRSPNDLSESFEAKMLASLVAQCHQEQNDVVHYPSVLPQLLNSRDFSVCYPKKITPRTEALIGESYNDEESSEAITGHDIDGFNQFSNRIGGNVDFNNMQNEWKSHLNCSQDTFRSIDVLSNRTDISCHLSSIEENNSNMSLRKSSNFQPEDSILVRYIPEFDCYFDPYSEKFYEHTPLI